MITTDTGLGIDYGKLWSDVKTAAGGLPGELYQQVKKTVEGKVTQAVTPTVQAQVEAKAQRVMSKGNIALMAAIGATAGLLIAGGSWQRRTVGGSVGAILGGLAGLKVGLVGDSL
jgi:hypothetical protein